MPPLDRRKKMLAAGAAAVVALALYARSRSAGGGSSTATGPQGAYDSTAADAAKYADSQDAALQAELDQAQKQVDAQGQRLAWAGGQLKHQGDLIHQLQHPKAPPKPTNVPKQRPGGKVKNEPVWAGAKLPLGK